MLSEVLRAGHEPTAGLSHLRTPDSILMSYVNVVRRDGARYHGQARCGRVPLPPRASWSTPFFPLACLVDRQLPSPQRRAVEPGNRRLGLRAVWHLDKAKAAGVPSITIGHNPNGLHSPIRFEAGTKLLVGGRKADIEHP
jgi:hypothetical protein